MRGIELASHRIPACRAALQGSLRMAYVFIHKIISAMNRDIWDGVIHLLVFVWTMGQSRGFFRRFPAHGAFAGVVDKEHGTTPTTPQTKHGSERIGMRAGHSRRWGYGLVFGVFSVT